MNIPFYKYHANGNDFVLVLSKNLEEKYIKDDKAQLRNNFNINTVKKLLERFKSNQIYENENITDPRKASFSRNKRSIHLCLKKSKDISDEKFVNTLTFVMLHEMAHVCTDSIGHTKEFLDKFKFLLHEAVQSNLFTAINYKKEPTMFCGQPIIHNPLYDNII